MLLRAPGHQEKTQFFKKSDDPLLRSLGHQQIGQKIYDG
jgi:hypothetical protein